MAILPQWIDDLPKRLYPDAWKTDQWWHAVPFCRYFWWREMFHFLASLAVGLGAFLAERAVPQIPYVAIFCGTYLALMWTKELLEVRNQGATKTVFDILFHSLGVGIFLTLHIAI